MEHGNPLPRSSYRRFANSSVKRIADRIPSSASPRTPPTRCRRTGYGPNPHTALRPHPFGLPPLGRRLHFSLHRFPPNLFAVTALEQLREIHATVLGNQAFAAQCQALAADVRQAVDTYARTVHGRHGEIYAYEVDGFGNRLFQDDANVPSLLSLPLSGVLRRGRSAVSADASLRA